MTVYADKPERLLTQISTDSAIMSKSSYCAGFELKAWRCNALADHLIDWIADYALKEEELSGSHGNMYVRLKQAAARIYSTENYGKRGEIGEILLHAVCRDFFSTIPLAPRVFYLTSSNEVVKSFDLVHVRPLDTSSFEIWLGEAKFYKDSDDAIRAAISSVEAHIDQGFLNNEKLILGPQVSKDVPYWAEIRKLLSSRTSLDELFKSAVFPICIACDSYAVGGHETHCESYSAAVVKEIDILASKVVDSGLNQKITIQLIYVPLASKDSLAEAFDKRLKGLSP
ncbi:DUF1837 domain-containing protein [Agrobacterium tumefaciens]|uniref:DUF1837 domain-containing protein n=1 Tax=Agrobacterium tumefaciens TaxID=358 RepID=A0A4D7Z1E5_AGRTU|nr:MULTISPECIES: DUF1837 domain-containing protein [Agrobacterium]MDA5245325.1 DUF1837 domain-containing protein [Agrobacterium sp. MAFF310724]MDA5246246.1 DUF1837 domain-containing protein [Agrobacterium sp. MAFF210268]QCL96073.1 DUF1837 domain-containing protein [Agrobacterium tumefaciens]TRB17636.1 DUF1837 domain-containing protein [Agrobacterium tumefaciens]